MGVSQLNTGSAPHGRGNWPDATRARPGSESRVSHVTARSRRGPSGGDAAWNTRGRPVRPGRVKAGFAFDANSGPNTETMKLSHFIVATLSGLVLSVVSGQSSARDDVGDLGLGVPTTSGTYTSNGPSNCNCTSAEAELTVSVGKTVTVTVGDSSFNISTGTQSGQSGSQTVPPGKCIYYQYVFTKEPGLFGGWCFKSAALKCRQADDDDC